MDLPRRRSLSPPRRSSSPSSLQDRDYRRRLPGPTNDEPWRWELDVPTPRAHLIVLRSRPDLGKAESWEHLNADERKAVIEFASRHVPLVERDHLAVFSIHRGSWKTDEKLHFHVCVDSGEYLKFAARNKPKLDVARLKANRNWRKLLGNQTLSTMNPNNALDLYLEAVKRSEQQRNAYWTDDVRAAESSLTRDESSAEKEKRTAALRALVQGSGCELVYHPTQPRLGLKPLTGALVPSVYLDLLLTLERELRSQSKQYGAHFVVALHGSVARYDDVFAKSGVQAYIHTHPELYVFYHPSPHQWLQCAMREENVHLHT